MPVRTGFTTINRYTRLVGRITSVMRATLKPHITRLNGSIGSGTDRGRTTVWDGNKLVESFAQAGPCNATKAQNNRTKNVRRLLRRDQVITTGRQSMVHSAIFGSRSLRDNKAASRSNTMGYYPTWEFRNRELCHRRRSCLPGEKYFLLPQRQSPPSPV